MSIRCIMLGYAEGQKAYQLWVPEKQKIIHAESVYFDEDSSFHDRTDDSLPLVDLQDKEPMPPKQEPSPIDSPLDSVSTEHADMETETHLDIPPMQMPHPPISKSISQTNPISHSST